MKKNLLSTTVLIMLVFGNSLNAEEKMPNAQAGQCFTKSFYPPKITKTIRTTSTKKVKISDSTVKYKVIPAKYTWYEKQIKISDGTEKIVVTPAVFKTVPKKILIQAAKKIWKKGLNLNAEKAYSSCIQAAQQSGLNTTNTTAGTCYYEHFQPANYITTTQKILTSEASERIIAIPATYRTITKKIATSNSSMKLVPVPIKYKKVQEKVTVEPARSEWRKTTCQDQGCNQSEVVCLTEIPRTFKTITKKIILEPAVAKKVAVEPIYKYVQAQELVSASSTKSIPIPANYKTIASTKKVSDAKYFWTNHSSKNESTRITNECDKICLVEVPALYKTVLTKVIETPALSKKVLTPPQYKVVKIKKVEKEASFKTIIVPAEYVEVQVEKERTKGYAKWMPMVCESAMVPSLIKKVQEALKYQGYYHGQIDGIWGLEEKSAVRAYQKVNGLPVTQLSIETMKSLGIQ
ncbi:MAG: Reverse transcriptase [uncultured Sulfurovum sp.]|uniref:Reverse transcriptase n=1 Tax=uncultured Sulfurovum sp. TaxID=269237 RepID=A0A6S6THV3_9BACT|nr:MAG: Reverse transcriptase [uncultured Sulfurovum sp.]